MYKKIITFGILTIFSFGITIGTANQSDLKLVNMIAVAAMTIFGIVCFKFIMNGIRTNLSNFVRLSEDGIKQQVNTNEAQLDKQENAAQLITSKISENTAQLVDELATAIDSVNHTVIKELRNNADQVVSASSDTIDKLDTVSQEIIENVVLSSDVLTAGVKTIHENTQNNSREMVTNIRSIHEQAAKQLILDVQTLTNDLTKHNASSITKLGDKISDLNMNVAGSITKLGNSEEVLATRIDKSYKELKDFASMTLKDGMKVVQEQAQTQNEEVLKLLLISTQKQEEALEKMTSDLQKNNATTLEDVDEVLTKTVSVVKRSNENLMNTLEEISEVSADTMKQLINKYAEFEVGYQQQYKYFQAQTDALTKLNNQDIKVLEKIANGKGAV